MPGKAQTMHKGFRIMRPGRARGSGLQHPREPRRTTGPVLPPSHSPCIPSHTFVFSSRFFRSSSSAVEVGRTLGARYNHRRIRRRARNFVAFVMHAARRGGLAGLRPPRNEIKASGEAGREKLRDGRKCGSYEVNT